MENTKTDEVRGVEGAINNAQEKVENAVEQVKEVVETVQEKVENVAEQVKEVVETVQEKVEDTVEQVTDVVETVQEKVEDATEQVKEAIETIEGTVSTTQKAIEESMETIEDAADDAANAIKDLKDVANNKKKWFKKIIKMFTNACLKPSNQTVDSQTQIPESFEPDTPEESKVEENVSSLRDAILSLISNPSYRFDLGKAARESVVRHHSLEAAVEAEWYAYSALTSKAE